MAKRNDALGVTGAETVIGSGVTLKGTLKSASDMMVDGTITGDIHAVGDITVGVNALIKANVTAASVVIAGSIKGNVIAEGEVHIQESGQVHGNITSSGLAIDSGGIFIGTSTITGDLRAKDDEN